MSINKKHNGSGDDGDNEKTNRIDYPLTFVQKCRVELRTLDTVLGAVESALRGDHSPLERRDVLQRLANTFRAIGHTFEDGYLVVSDYVDQVDAYIVAYDEAHSGNDEEDTEPGQNKNKNTIK